MSTLFTNFPAFKVGSKMASLPKSKILIQKLDINKMVERSQMVEVSQIRYPVVKPDEFKKMMRSFSMTKRQSTSQARIGKSPEPMPISSIKENTKIVRFLQKKDFSNKGFSFTETSQNIRIFSPRTSRERKIEPTIDYNIQQEKEKEQKIVISQKILQSMMVKKKPSTREKMPLNNVNLIEALHQANLPKDAPPSQNQGSQTDRPTKLYDNERYIAQTEISPKAMTKTDYLFRIKPSFIESIKEKNVNIGIDRSVSHPDIMIQNLFTEGKDSAPSSRVQSKHTHRVSTEYAKHRKAIPDKTADLSASNARFEYYKKIQSITNPPYWEQWGKTLARLDEKDRKSREEKEIQKNKSKDKIKPFISPFVRYREGMYRNGSPNEGRRDSSNMMLQREQQQQQQQKSDYDTELEQERTEPLSINKLESRNSQTLPDLPLATIDKRLL